MKHFATQDVGRRNYQEDRYLSLLSHGKEKNMFFFAVADGMGGHKAGDLAAEIVVDTLKEFWERLVNDMPEYINGLDEKLELAILEANEKIKQASRLDPSKSGMGATCCCALVFDDQAIVANVGDSRVYFYTRQKIEQITKDHTAVQEALDQGIPPESITVGSNVLVRCVDGSDDLIVDLFPAFGSFDVSERNLFLCSDGITASLSNNDIHKLLRQAISLEKKAQNLIKQSMDFGSSDNISVVLAEQEGKFEKISPISPTANQQPPKKQNDFAVKMAFLALIIFSSMLMGYLIYPMIQDTPGTGTIEETGQYVELTIEKCLDKNENLIVGTTANLTVNSEKYEIPCESENSTKIELLTSTESLALSATLTDYDYTGVNRIYAISDFASIPLRFSKTAGEGEETASNDTELVFQVQPASSEVNIVNTDNSERVTFNSNNKANEVPEGTYKWTASAGGYIKSGIIDISEGENILLAVGLQEEDQELEIDHVKIKLFDKDYDFDADGDISFQNKVLTMNGTLLNRIIAGLRNKCNGSVQINFGKSELYVDDSENINPGFGIYTVGDQDNWNMIARCLQINPDALRRSDGNTGDRDNISTDDILNFQFP